MEAAQAEQRAPGRGLSFDPAEEQLFRDARDRQTTALAGRERLIEFLSAGIFLLAAAACLLLLPSDRALQLGPAVAAVAAYALAARVEFHTGAGWAVPTQLVFVPMLFVLPARAVPLLVAAALVLSKLPELAGGELHRDRVAVLAGTAWYSIGPALVLSLSGAQTPAWGDWPIYLGALAAQFAVDGAIAWIHGSLSLRLDPSRHVRELGQAYLVDALLAPIGLLAAFASTGQSYAFLLVLPLVGLLAIFARERAGRIENALTLSRAYRGTALLLGELLSAGDKYTGDHSRRVVILSQKVGNMMDLDDRELRDLEFAALLHDVGKLAIPKEILTKPGPLTPDEFAVMKRHVEEGQLMLERIGGVLGEAGYVVRSHHEHFDGRGYPDGLAGSEIPLAARIITGCDAFNAMTTDRPYRRAMSVADAVAELRSHAGRQFDPDVVELLCATIEAGEGAIGS